MRNLSKCVVAALFAPITLGAQAPLPAAAAVARVIDSLANDFVANGGAPSVSIAVVRGADTIALKAWGVADREKNVAATSAVVYRIGSVTKQFTASIVMQLVQEKKIDLDDPIGKYLATLPAAWHGATVRQLLNHTSGIPDYTHLGATWMAHWADEMTPAQIIALTADTPLDFPSGTKWSYDNTGYVVLGAIIEKVTGHTWSAEVQTRLAKPLGLHDTKVCSNQPGSKDAHGYEFQNGAWQPTPYLSMSQPYSAGSLCSTAGDLSTWNRALHTGKVVSAASYAMMTTPSGAAVANNYGFGLGHATLPNYSIITHGGAINGSITANSWTPGPNLSVTVLTNSGSAKADDLMEQLTRAALGIPLRTKAVARAISAAQRAKYLGVYALELPGGARDLTVTERGDDVTAQLVGQGANPILYLGDDTFGVTFDPALRFVFTVENGKAVSVTLKQGGGVFVGKRKP